MVTCSLPCRTLCSHQLIDVLFTMSQNLQETPVHSRTLITIIVFLELELKLLQNSIFHILHLMEQTIILSGNNHGFFFVLFLSLLFIHIVYYAQICWSHIIVNLSEIPSPLLLEWVLETKIPLLLPFSIHKLNTLKSQEYLWYLSSCVKIWESYLLHIPFVDV